MAAGVPPAPPGPGDRKSRRLPAGLLLATVIALVLLGAVYVTYEIRQMRAEAGAQLAAVAELKAAQIENWLGERRADTGVLARSPFLFDDAGPLVPPDPSGAAPAKLAAYLERVRTAYGYSSVAFFDSGLRPVVAVPRSSAPADAAETELLRAAWRAGGVVTGELVRTGAGPVLLDFVAPVFSADGTTPAGAVRLRMDAGAHLFPLLARWPSPSETAESILFRREGDSLAYLSPLRHRPGAASGLRLPLSQASLLAAAAVLDPRADAIEGVTYRGVRGLAVARPVSGTPWKLIAQVDLSEAYGPARDEALRLVVGLALVLALALLAVSLLWRERHFDLLRRERDAERARLETAERLALVLRHANDAILLVADDLRLVEANDRASVLYGYAPDELLRLSVSDLRAAETSAALADDLAATRQAGGRVFETIHRRKDGTAFPVEVSSRPVEIGGRPHLLALLRDISERKEHERQLERLNRMYLALSRVGEAIVHATDDAALAGSVCRILVEAGGFTLTWVGRLDTSGALVPQAQAGDDTGYVEGIRVSVDTSPEGRGPAGTAFREGRPVVVNDFLADPTTAPWRERAEKSGLRSSIALPLYRLGSATGALMIYAGEKDTFGEAEIALAEEVAGNLSFAFDVLARDEERRAAEQALRVREEVFSSIVGQALDAIALVDAGTGRFVEFNEAAHRNLGYSREDFAGLGIDDIQAGQSRDETGLVIGKMLGLGSADFETRHRHRSGAIRSVHVRARLLTLQERPHIAAVWTDITERKGAELERQQAQEALRENEARLNEAQRIAHIGVWELDHHRDRRIWSDEMYRIFGVPPNALAATSETFLGFIHPEDRERAVTSFAASLAHRAAYEIDYRLLLRDGSVKQVHERCETWFDEAGTPLRSFGTVQDVTAHHQAEARLRQLSSAVEQSPVSIVITDLTGAIEYVNPYFSLVTGYDFEEVRGQNPRVLKSGKTPEASYVEMWRTLVAGQVWRGELHNRKKNGETFPEQAVIAPIAGQDGRVTHYVAIKEDITERKRSDDALRDSESRFRRLFEAAPVPLCVVQGATGVLNLNERFVETFGYTGADLATIDDWWLRAYPDAARRAGYRQSWDAALATALERGSDVPPMEV
ncbi:MAG: PAS domain S-box protein, partial [Holophagales bacterium]|nr:PAS domain S-box protein [Holophagales bacterium]